MIAIHLSKSPPSLRGDLTKWLNEISTGFYVGHVSARVRELLWERITKTIKDGEAIMAYSINNEQHFICRSWNTRQMLIDSDGVQLVYHPDKKLESAQDGKVKPILSPEIIKKKAKFPESTFIAMDIETTGLEPKTDQIIEVALVRFENKMVQEKLILYINPHKPLPAIITQLTGITDCLLEEKGIEEKEALRQIVEFIKDAPLVCHNAPFDLAFLNEVFKRYEFKFSLPYVFDTLTLAREYVHDVPNYKLATLKKRFKLEEGSSGHEAFSDAQATGKLMLILQNF